MVLKLLSFAGLMLLTLESIAKLFVPYAGSIRMMSQSQFRTHDNRYLYHKPPCRYPSSLVGKCPVYTYRVLLFRLVLATATELSGSRQYRVPYRCLGLASLGVPTETNDEGMVSATFKSRIS